MKKSPQLTLDFEPPWQNEPPTKKGWKNINRKRRHYKNIGITQQIHRSPHWGLYLVQQNNHEQSKSWREYLAK